MQETSLQAAAHLPKSSPDLRHESAIRLLQNQIQGKLKRLQTQIMNSPLKVKHEEQTIALCNTMIKVIFQSKIKE